MLEMMRKKQWYKRSLKANHSQSLSSIYQGLRIQPERKRQLRRNQQRSRARRPLFKFQRVQRKRSAKLNSGRKRCLQTPVMLIEQKAAAQEDARAARAHRSVNR